MNDDDPVTIGSPTYPEGLSSGQLFVGPSDDPDRYELLDDGILGGEGRTWRAAYRGGLNQPLIQAVKMLFPPANTTGVWPTEADMRRWRDQAVLLRHLSQPHVVQLHELFTGPAPHSRDSDILGGSTVAYLLMEWVDGPTLAQHLHGSPATATDLPTRLRYIHEIATAVHTLHSFTRSAGNPVLHRDLTPSNCIVHDRRGIVLIDISGMRLIEDALDPWGRHTPAYAAPEVLGAPFAPRQPSSDLYAVGALALFCMTGTDPRPQQSDTEMRDQLSALLTRAEASQPDEAASHLLQMLAAEPADRPSDVLAWSTTLATLAEPCEGQAVKTTDRPKAPKLLRRRRRIAVVVLSVGLVFAALALWAGDPFQGANAKLGGSTEHGAETGGTPLGPARQASAGFSASDFHSTRGTIKSPGTQDQVRNCEYFTGSADPGPGKTLMLAQHNLAEKETIRYVQPVFDYPNPRTDWTWRAAQYFNDNAIGKNVLIELIEVPLNDKLRDAEAAINAGSENAYLKESAIADQGTVLAAVTVVHVDQEHPSGDCVGP